MGNQADNKFTWVIKNFSSLQSEKIYSDQFVISGCKWRLVIYPSGDGISKCMSLYLDFASSKHLPTGWRKHTNLRLFVANQLAEKQSIKKVYYKWFDQKTPSSVFLALIPYSTLLAEDSGFLVNGELKIVIQIDLCRFICKEELLQESEEASRPLKKIKPNDNDGAVSSDLHNETQQVKEMIDVNGFQVLPSQVEFVTRLLEKHPDIAVDIRTKNTHLKKGCMNLLLSLIETLCQSTQELSDDDLVEAENALAYVEYSGLKDVGWLKTKLEEVKEKKNEEKTSETRIQKLEEELKDMEALLEKEKTKLLATRAPLTLDDFL